MLLPHTRRSYPHCVPLCQSSHVLNMFTLGSVISFRQNSHLPASSRKCFCLEETSFLLHRQQSLYNGCGDKISTVSETRAVDRAYPLAELKTTLTWVKKYGFIVILIKRNSVTLLDRRLDGHYVEVYIMVLAQNRTLVFGAPEQ